MRTGGNTIYLKAGQLIALPAGQPHAMQAITDVTLLVTILRHAKRGSQTIGKE
jgi:quercetin dioxygenase-like cupin family protein